MLSRYISQFKVPLLCLKNGAARLKKRGQRVRYKCYRGYSLVGPVSARCEAGVWQPQEVPVNINICSA